MHGALRYSNEGLVSTDSMFLRVLLSFVLFLPLVTLARDSCPFYDIDIEAKLAKVSMVNHKDATCRKPRFPYTYPRPLRCSFEWEDRNKLKRTVLKYLKERFKVLLYFKTHVKGYNNHEVNYFNYTGWITWVWVLKDYKYLLNYPHNFYTLSLATTDIIIEEFEVKGKCDENCTKTIGYKSCGLGQKELVSFLQEVTKDTSFVWEKVCLHANIGTSHLVTPHSYMFLPDLLYYGYFIHALYFYDLTGFSRTKYFPNYYCYRSSDLECESTGIWHHYDIIILFAFIIWLYCPLLIYYFPSSDGGNKFDKDFYTSHATPYHFMKLIRSILCYYPDLDFHMSRIIRRLFFILLLAPPTIRMLLLYPHYFVITFMVLCICCALPSYLSLWIIPEQPSHFQPIPFLVKWPYPRGMVQQSKGIEYQLLANIMEERIFLITDMHFWSFIYKRSCGLFEGPQHYSIIIQWICYPFMMCLKIIVVIISVVVSILYFLIPWLYFCKEIFNAVVRGERNTYNKNKTIFHLFMVTFHGLGLLILFVFSMLCVFVYCFFLAEVTVYTLIGCVLTPDKAYKYIVLVGAFVGAIYFMINQLQGSYSEILDEIIGSFHDESRLQLLQKDLTANVSLNRKDEDDSIRYSISITRNTPIGSCRGVSTSTNSIPPSNVLMSFDGITTKVSKELFHGIVEQYQPLRKKVFTIIVRVAIMLFYIVVTMHAKNVYHLEKNVSNIFGLAQGLAISFVPAVMTFLGFKNRFGKKKTVLLKVNIHQAILHYIENCKV